MLLVGWTTVSQQGDAERLAKNLTEQQLAVCVQIEGPIASHYIWQGKCEAAAEFRLTVKFLPAKKRAVEDWLLKNQPYEVPEWVVVRAEDVAEKYLSWARTNGTSAPL